MHDCGKQGCDHRVTLGAENSGLFCVFLLNSTLKIMMTRAEFSPKAEKSHPWTIRLKVRHTHILY